MSADDRSLDEDEEDDEEDDDEDEEDEDSGCASASHGLARAHRPAPRKTDHSPTVVCVCDFFDYTFDIEQNNDETRQMRLKNPHE